ncbi:M1 family metallopeptidase [Mucilaginibacter sp. UR6-11]|uniref:M1 family metallopeptidase n=1 Tax=Mucilaginibacter sp. UR6-11 TaxID=1435644 RepID=UPI001E28A66D|nr:M1 family metallopeptidase [Mucilaginibacter sp. UR6-11]MCC8425405.1 M1 family metallopeptidase [Mucilaginibacter sp. UR6-11]
MLKSFSIPALLCLFMIQANAQNLYMPRDIHKAFNKGTRDVSGKPGKNYWQNTGNYNISISLAPPSRLVKGVEQITYFNNSPDTLKRLNMKLILNIHRPGVARYSSVNDDYLTSGIQVDNFLVNGARHNWNNTTAAGTNQAIALATPLMPHDSVKLNIDWHFDLSKESGREGMIDSTTFYLAYFYPRVSVYDDYNGWDTLAFLDAQEFYNDFNNYTLNVTVPKNYIVWSTGTLQNPNQVLQPEAAKRLQQSMTSDSTIHIATPADLAAKNITAQNATNTWTWTATDISDMAVGVSDHYNWDGASVLVDDATHRIASVQAAYPDKSQDFHHSVQFSRNALGWFSHNWPGVPYPFPKMTVFQGFADMEYPMMVNDSHEEDLGFAQLVQDHEIAHTYFPFYMGINETRYGFMDEGWATTFELLIGTAENGKKKADDFYKKFRVEGYINNPSTMEDLPVITPTSELRRGYGNNAYGKPSLSYLALKDMLGDALFKKALHTYMNNWHGKHPIPWDYFNSMNAGSGKNLNWFFNNWFFTNGYIDLGLDNAKAVAGGYKLSINNIGGFAVPFDVIVTYTDGTTKSTHATAAVWEKDSKHITITINANKTAKSIALDGGIFMDADVSNNQLTVK